jgi:competence protein ComEA
MSNIQDKIAFGLACFLVLLLITGGTILAVKTLGNRPEEITIHSPQPASSTYEVNISGAVHNPGIYSVTDNDTILSLLNNAGISADTGSLSITLNVTDGNQYTSPQKININTADGWLLQALPEIGEGKAQTIITYRQQNGGFRNIYELQQVDGISAVTFDKIKDLITVGDF